MSRPTALRFSRRHSASMFWCGKAVEAPWLLVAARTEPGPSSSPDSTNGAALGRFAAKMRPGRTFEDTGGARAPTAASPLTSRVDAGVHASCRRPNDVSLRRRDESEVLRSLSAYPHLEPRDRRGLGRPGAGQLGRVRRPMGPRVRSENRFMKLNSRHNDRPRTCKAPGPAVRISARRHRRTNSAYPKTVFDFLKGPKLSVRDTRIIPAGRLLRQNPGS